MNQIRIRDVIADDDTTFEVHKLEHIKDKQSGEAGSGLMMRLQCRDEEESVDVDVANSEVAKSVAKMTMRGSQSMAPACAQLP